MGVDVETVAVSELGAAERALWKIANIDVAGIDKGPWYKEIGQGMGAALNTGNVDRGDSVAVIGCPSDHTRVAPRQMPRPPSVTMKAGISA